jgi:membrane fusion protein (multidrug efflux system)
VTIVKVKPIRVRFSISTNDYLSGYGSLQNLQKNASVKVRLSDGKVYPVEGVIKFLNNEANSRTDAIQVFAEFPNDDLRLLNGSTVGVTLSRKTSEKVTAIPLSAVVYDSNGACVYVVDKENKAKKQYIKTGGSNQEYQFVESGLKPGQDIISAGTHKIMMDGMTVEIAK